MSKYISKYNTWVKVKSPDALCGFGQSLKTDTGFQVHIIIKAMTEAK